ncbi:CidA/LrgA family protein [Zavarzinia compransoris]|uniref:CidA/LrgA family protein n=1 Tax=Zavarzinia marina TaxID=2911065 RepID=UPI001F37D770|nr:CidA/LrgA family protein [Zavarzinia marina]MCF4165263.1 CidA/LrgA family protein [Zavarzinia marina]
MPRRILLSSQRILHRSRLVQLGLIVGFWWLGDAAVRAIGLPVPGGVIGMLLMLGLLLARGIGPCSVRRGADVLLGDMLLFFVPAVMGLLDHGEFLGLLGAKIFLLILVGTLLVMAGTALTVELVQRLMARSGADHAR